ncbi:uracil-DNA glycosylase-like protein [Morchella snyderi]|nr:uracil-DNA glycosylase-like protein [Morchella snyderi]
MPQLQVHAHGCRMLCPPPRLDTFENPNIATPYDASSSEEAYEPGPSRTTKPKPKSKPKSKPKPKPKSKPKPDATKRKRTAPGGPSARTGARQAKRQRQRTGAAATVAVAVAVGAEAGQQAGGHGGQELRTVPDALAPSLICVLIGLNPGLMTAAVGHMYAHPRNHFWRLMHAGGLTPDRVCPPEMDQRLPAVYSLGLTNLVERASVGQADLSRAEMAAGVAVCEAKLRRWRPESVCIVGKGIWEAIWQARRGRRLTKEQFVWGWQEEKWGAGQGWEGARVYVVPSTSGLVAGISMEFKTECWRTLGDWVQMRRRERGEVAPRDAIRVKEEGIKEEDES